MSDYISGLRGDLVEAAARHQARGSLARRGLPALPRAWSRPALAAAAAAAACLAAIVVAVSTLGPPTPAPTRPHTIVSVHLGLEAFAAASAVGDLWVAGTNGELARVDPAQRRVVARLRLGDQATSIAAAGDAVWATAIDEGASARSDGTMPGSLYGIDARTGAIRRRIRMTTNGMGPVAPTAAGVWLVPDAQQAQTRLERYDPASGRRAALIRSVYRNALVAGDGVLWALGVNGDVAQIDPVRNRIVAVVPGVSETDNQNGPSWNALAADGDGVWVAGGTRGDMALVQAGRVVKRIRVGEGAVGAVARTRHALWATFETGSPNRRFRAIRFDLETGRPTGTVELGHRQPTAIAAAGDGLWIVTLDGTAALIR